MQNNTKFSQEFRLFHQGDTIDWVAGFFYEKSKEDWDFTTFAEGYDQSHVHDNYLWREHDRQRQPDSHPLPGDAWWYSDDDTEWKQWAIFGEVTWHITDTLDLTGGARWFSRKMDKVYYVETAALQPNGRRLS